MALNIIYALQAVLGFFQWKLIDPERKPAYRIKIKQHIMVVSSCLILSITFYTVLRYFDDRFFLFWDLVLASGSIMATFLEIRKDNSCWWYWIVCNLGYALLYYYTPGAAHTMMLYALLMLILAVFSGFALKAWTNHSSRINEEL